MNNINPIISVIVPAYNAEKYLRRCIDSILAQTFTDFELLLIDDGSTDKSGEICDEYADKDARIRVFHKANGGVSSARNVGLDNALGEYICFCDADDWVDTHWLQGFIEVYPNDLIVQGFCYKNPDQKNWEKCKINNECKKVLDALDYLHRVKNMGYLWCRCFKSSIIKDNNIRFNEKIVVREDYDFIICFCTHIRNVMLVSNCSYYYLMPDFTGIKYSNVKNDSECILSLLNNIHLIVGDNCHREFVLSEVVRLQNNIFKELLGKDKTVYSYMNKYEQIKHITNYTPLTLKEKLKDIYIRVMNKIHKYYV